MSNPYAIADTSAIFSPGLVFFRDLIRQNIERMVQMAGAPDRLRPHAKTHKTREIARMQLDAGITKHKCATIAEAEMLASAGVPDVLLSYPIVGPNVGRLVELVRRYPACRLSVLVDHPVAAVALSQGFAAAGLEVDVMLDIDVGQHRTGIAPGPDAQALYEQVARLPGLRPAGLHVYDGHNHQESSEERTRTALTQLEPALQLRSRLEKAGYTVPHFVVGGTPTFPVYARLDLPGLECSPGTLVLHDHGYGSRFADLAGFVPAALLLTRVISRPTPTRVTFDLGYKAIASDPPAGKRLRMLELPGHEAILQNEEHLVLEMAEPSGLLPGDEALAIPTHICPTVAMHQSAYVIAGGKLVGKWDIVGRNRVLEV